MPAPVILTPAAIKLVGVAAATALAVAAARRRSREPLNEAREAALDAAPEDGEFATRLHRREARADAAGRWRRTVRVGRRGLEIDIAAIGRARFRAV